MDNQFNEIYVKDVLRLLFSKTIVSYVKSKDPNGRSKPSSSKTSKELSVARLVLRNVLRLQESHYFTGIYLTAANQIYEVLTTESRFLIELRRFYYNVS